MNAGGGNPTKLAKAHEQEQRRRTVAALRLAGVNDQSAIARQLNVSQPTISRDFAAINEQWRKESAADIAELKGRQAERIEEMIKGLWKEARNGKWLAVDRVVTLLKREAELFGLDAPKRTELTGANGEPVAVEIKTIVAVIPGQTMPELPE
jgi:DeoR/GlpR family transcriptional regulator of sugar metabolism